MEEKKNWTIYEKLMLIQDEVKVPKNLKNKFGNYNYRNAEQILKDVKTVAKKYGCVVVIDDDIRVYGERFYVCSEVTLYDVATQESVVAHGHAREAETKTGMDASQITGAATSYARKYALGALFGIDDGIDADSMDNREEGKPKTNDAFADAMKQIDECETIDELKGLWERAKSLHTNKEFVALVNHKKAQLATFIGK